MSSLSTPVSFLSAGSEVWALAGCACVCVCASVSAWICVFCYVFARMLGIIVLCLCRCVDDGLREKAPSTD